jgi:hypothetical protein
MTGPQLRGARTPRRLAARSLDAEVALIDLG